MKILFVGVFNWPWATSISMANALEKLGHEVTRFSYREIAENKFNTKSRPIRRIETKLNNWFKKAAPVSLMNKFSYILEGKSEIQNQLLSKVKSQKFDLVILSKSDSVDYRIIDDINRYSKTWYYFMDWMGTCIRVHGYEYAKRTHFASSNCSDIYNLFKRCNHNSHYLTQGVNTEIFNYKKTKKEIDVCFVGSIDLKRNKIIQYLKNNGINVEIFGNNSNNGFIYGDNLAKLYQKSKIILNLSRCPVGFSLRVFQALGCGSFMISQRCDDLEKIFKRKKHLEWFDSKEECLQLIKYYLKNSDMREKIAKSGNIFVFKQYSWQKVMKRMIDIVNNGYYQVK